jgi:hypothetical protein
VGDNRGMASGLSVLSAALRLPALHAASRRRRQAGWVQLAGNLVPLVGVLLLGWSFAEMLLVFFFETALFVLLAPWQFAPARPVVQILKVVGWYVGWCLIFGIYSLMGLGVSTIAEAERFKGVGDSYTAAFNVIFTGSLARGPTLAEFFSHPIAASMAVAAVTAALAVRRDESGPARLLIAECMVRGVYFHVGLCYFGIAMIFVLAYVPSLTAAFVTLPLVGFKILGDAREEKGGT